MRVIGIDVGGTNTDAVLLEDGEVRRAAKTPTTADVTGGMVTALRLITEPAGAGPRVADAVMVGTTHFTNAVVERRRLVKVAAVRIGLPATAFLEPFIDWPPDLAAVVRDRHFMVAGGHEFDGRPLVPLDLGALQAAAREIRAAGVRSVAVTSVFSPLDPGCEERAAAILREHCPDLAITLSHHLGRIGLLPRENAALLNASLVDLARDTVAGFTRALADAGVRAPLYLTQNDGTVLPAEQAQAFPVFSFASGPTNSMRGAAFLSGLDEALVVDVGGTTADLGALRHGFPREANNVVEVGGVRTLFRMPDLLSVALGGGTLVTGDPPAVGPRSVGYELTTRARVFGGRELTLTDVAVARGLVDLGDRGRVRDLPRPLLDQVAAHVRRVIEESVDRMKTDAADVPLVAVGGGAFLVPPELLGVSRVVRVPHHAVANAVGAAIAQVSGETDHIFRDVGREEAIQEARRQAEEKAIKAHARPETLRVVEVEDLPLAYLPGNSLRVRVKVVGSIG
jgi:N-methylhydantoinase A/oxoprolinase/acetone carboxylase beta subunit